MNNRAVLGYLDNPMNGEIWTWTTVTNRLSWRVWTFSSDSWVFSRSHIRNIAKRSSYDSLGYHRFLCLGIYQMIQWPWINTSISKCVKAKFLPLLPWGLSWDELKVVRKPVERPYLSRVEWVWGPTVARGTSQNIPIWKWFTPISKD